MPYERQLIRTKFFSFQYCMKQILWIKLSKEIFFRFFRGKKKDTPTWLDTNARKEFIQYGR